MTRIKHIYILVLFSGVFFKCQIQKPQLKNNKTENNKISIVIPEEKPVAVFSNLILSKEDLKNEIRSLPQLDSLSQEDLLNDFVKKKLLLLEARKQGLDTSDIFIEENKTYQQITINNYLNDKEVINQLKNETYERYKYEINASHIFIPLSWYASPADTFKIYEDLMQLRNFAIKKDNFPVLAREWSKDDKTNQKGGALGWFTALHLIYPLEKVAFNIPVDSISLPIRTKAGYHLIKINDKRPNSGYVKVQHLFKYIKPDVEKTYFENTLRTLDSLRYIANQVGNFDELVQKYSDDQQSLQKNGELPIFGIGTREESTFEEAAFSLKKFEISKPIRSTSGIHLIRLIDKFPPDNKEVYLRKIENKLITDSRAEFLIQQRLSKISKYHKLKIYDDILNTAQSLIDDRLMFRSWKYKPNEIDLFVLFSIEDQSFLVKDFLKYLEEHQSYEKWSKDDNTYSIFRMLFEKYLNKQLLNYEERVAINNSKELQFLFKLQEENLLINKLLNQTVIQKSLNDTTGQKLFYEKNMNLFPEKEVGIYKSFSFANDSVYKSFQSLKSKPKPYKLNRGIKPFYFEKNQFGIGPEAKRRLLGLIVILKNNPNYIVEISGHRDINEENEVSDQRLKAFVKYLKDQGLPLTRILEVNASNTKPADRFDWQKNQRVSIQFFSNFEGDLIKSLNSKQPNTVVFKENQYLKNDLEKKLGLKWKNQMGTFEYQGRIEEYSLTIKKTGRTFKDYKYDVVSYYQKQLENELINTLKQKYKVDINLKEFFKIIEETKKEQ